MAAGAAHLKGDQHFLAQFVLKFTVSSVNRNKGEGRRGNGDGGRGKGKQA